MLAIVRILGIEVPSYTVFALLGIGLALSVAVFWGKRYGFLQIDIVTGFCYGIFGTVLGAKLFYAIPFLPEFLKLCKTEGFSYVMGHFWQLLPKLFGGYVFYGGFLGMAAGVAIYAKIRKLPLLGLLDVVAVAVPLFHGFGRIGCFLAGCCYGREYHGRFAVQFPNNPYHAELALVERFPVQIVESIGNFALFLFLVFYGRKQRAEGRLFGIYLMVYSVMRFILEYFRGDELRGVWQIAGLSISFSQMISMLLFMIGVCVIAKFND